MPVLGRFWQRADKLATTFDANVREPNGFLRLQALRLTGSHGNPTNGAKDYFWGLVGHTIWSRFTGLHLVGVAMPISRHRCQRLNNVHEGPEVDSYRSLVSSRHGERYVQRQNWNNRML